jgi:CheY-like chemotaxis protein
MSHHILVVDDSATIRKAIDITFAHEDFELTTVSSGQEALAALSEKIPDIALVDANLTQENGVDLARDMLAQAPGEGFPLVLLSSNQDPVEQAVLDSAGIASQMAKPFHTQELIDAVKTHLGLQVEQSVAAMRFVPRAAKPQPEAQPATPPVAAPLSAPTPAAAVSAPPPVIKGPPPPAIKGPPPPAPASAIRKAPTPAPVVSPQEPELIAPPPAEQPPEPVLVTPPPAEAEAPAPALITPPPESFEAPAPALITPPPENNDFPPAITAPAPEDIDAPVRAEQAEAPLVPDFDSPAVTEPEHAPTELEMPPSLEVPELAPIPAPDAPTMVVRSVQAEDDDFYQPEPTHSLPALTDPVADLGLGIDLGSIEPEGTKSTDKITIADGEVDVEALMPVIEAAVRKVTAEVVERVVWEVVPDLAERLIREHLNNRDS